MMFIAFLSCVLFKQIALVNSQGTDVPVETIDPSFYTVLVSLLPDDYDIVNDISTWNFTQIYNLLTEDDPDLFYGLPTSALLELPESMLMWLGEEHPLVIAHHKLCDYLTNEDQILYNCTSNNTVYDTSCPDPFVDTIAPDCSFKMSNLKNCESLEFKDGFFMCEV